MTTNFIFSEKLNADFLNSSYGENLDFGKKMFSIFLSTIESDIEILSSGIKEEDFKRVSDVAHKIKNNFTWVGLPRLRSLMYRIESAAKEEDLIMSQLFEEMITQFEADHDLVKNEYDRLNLHLG